MRDREHNFLSYARISEKLEINRTSAFWQRTKHFCFKQPWPEKKKNILIKNNKNKKKAECREGTLITESTDEGRERTFYKLCSHQREMVEILLTIIPLFNWVQNIYV